MTVAGDGWFDFARRVDSPNFGPRPKGASVSLVVIHNISLPPGEFGGGWIEDFFLNRLDATVHPYFASIAGMQVSSHFVIRRGGEVVQFVSTENRAWHAGASCWQGRDNCNDFSIGVELEGADETPFDPAQYTSLRRLLEALCAAHSIAAIAGHSDIAPGRKTDPGPYFDWAVLRQCFPELSFPEEAA